MFDMAYIVGLVDTLREGDDAAKAEAAQMLGNRVRPRSHQVLIVEAGAIPLLVLIAEAGGIPRLVDLMEERRFDPMHYSAQALYNIAYNNDANAVAIAAAVGLEEIVQLARAAA
ncbi:hypothetical protein JL722_7509 [Aureococcus anophagefferens]|nr:hypothetical protein JL722_7509 [Aureococcus anophagefferens]